jgi:hypothetical protein
VPELLLVHVVLGEREAHGSPDLRGQAAHPVHLLLGSRQVLSHHAGGCELEDAVADLAEHAPDAEELVLGREGAGDRLAVHRAVHQRARGGEAQRAGFERLLHQRGHLRHVVRCRRLVARAALPHHVRAHRPVGHLGADVEHVGARFQDVQVLGKALPAPLDALGERRSGDVLDALHQADQEVLLARAHRGEADAAVAHHQGRDAVPARRREQRVPGGLSVVVGVDVHPARGHHLAASVDALAGRAQAAQRCGRRRWPRRLRAEDRRCRRRACLPR